MSTAVPTQAPPAQAPTQIPVPVVIAAPPPEEPERVISHVHLAMFRRYPLRCLAYGVAMVGLVSASVWAFAVDRQTLGTVFLALGVFVVARFLFWLIRMGRTVLVVTSRRVILEGGVFGREATEFALKDITDLHVQQGHVGALLDVGDLIIVSDNGTKRQAVVMAVPQPAAVAAHIRDCKGA